MKRRNFLKNTSLYSAAGIFMPGSLRSGWNFADRSERMQGSEAAIDGELLYNGIRLPAIWPPDYMDKDSYERMPVPYLETPPQVIPIDIGRQLFVDDFLIESTDLTREFHRARKYVSNPVFKPETALEKGDKGRPVACPKDGGVWWDPEERIFKMWYEAEWLENMAYAISVDGIRWNRPDLGSGNNLLFNNPRPDSTTVFIDHDTDNPAERFKMFLRGPNSAGADHGYCFVSADGIHWSDPVPTGYCGDRSTMFYNPFRRKWIYSIRSWRDPFGSGIGRARYYHEHSDFLSGARWTRDDAVFWMGADRFDSPDPVIGEKAQLYNLSAVAYESLMLGIHQIHLGPPNKDCDRQGIPKITELMLSFSRDGFHWHRPDRRPFIPAARQRGEWDRGYVQSVGGICVIVGDQLWFYYTGFRGDENKPGGKIGMYAHGSTGMAVLRRDGFASMSAKESEGILTTRPVCFSGKYMFVNADCSRGELKVELLDENSRLIPELSFADCIPVSGDSTLQLVKWKGVSDLSKWAGKKIRFRFQLKNGKLYAFWVSPDVSGASYGYVAAGGPGFKGSKDNLGAGAYQSAASIYI